MYAFSGFGVAALVLVSLGCTRAFFFDNECGGKPFNKETEMCCGDVSYPNSRYNRCCSGTIYDKRVSYCRLGMVFHDREKGCNGVYYVKDLYLCCDGKLYPKDPYIECCHGELMDNRASYCEWGMMINNDENGCANVYYKKEEEVCCNDKLYPNDGYTVCCSGQIIDTRASACVWGIVTHTRKGCAGKYFDKDIEFCCSDVVYTKDSTHSCCGGKTVYDPNTHSCEVAGFVWPKES